MPLTGLQELPDLPEIEDPLLREVLRLVHGDLDNFKAFNDHYGFMRGDEVIRFCGRCLQDAAHAIGQSDAFIGHTSGDDFVAIVDAEMAEAYCKEVIERFDDGILDYYDTADALRIHRGRGPAGERYAVPICSSLGVPAANREIKTQWEASAVAVEMKEFAKKKAGPPTRSTVAPVDGEGV